MNRPLNHVAPRNLAVGNRVRITGSTPHVIYTTQRPDSDIELARAVSAKEIPLVLVQNYNSKVIEVDEGGVWVEPESFQFDTSGSKRVRFLYGNIDLAEVIS